MCVYILCNCTTIIRNDNEPTFYSSVEEFEDSVNLEETPINQFPYTDYDDEYMEYAEVLFSYYYDENEIVLPQTSLFQDSDEESDDDNNYNNHPLMNKYSLITTVTDVDCNICFEQSNINYCKCKKRIFKICLACYETFNKNTCPMCKN